MRPRVLLVARENILGWAPFYRAAFEAVADVITAGKPLDAESMRRIFPSLLNEPYRTNDIVSESGDVVDLAARLPAGWEPDLVVQVQSADSPYRNVARLTCPTAYVSVDTWHDSEEYHTVRGYDAVFAAQRYFLDSFLAAGAPRAHWLPLGYDPANHFPGEAAEDHDVAFVGTLKFVVNQPRIRRLNRLREHFSVYLRQDLMGAAACDAWGRGKLAFNSSICADINMRVFEVMAMGRPMLMNRDAAVNGLFDLFEEGRHFIGYDDEADLVRQVRRYLDDSAARNRIGREAREAVRETHSYQRRAETLIETMGITRNTHRTRPLIRAGGTLVDWLPNAPGVTLDIGLGLERSRIALNHHGVTRCIGASGQPALREQKARSYDEMLEWPADGVEADSIDTVTWTHPFVHVREAGGVLRYAARVLHSGGTLVLRLSPQELAATGLPAEEAPWRAWFHEHGFHLLALEPPSDGNPWCILMARHFARPAAHVAADTYERFPAPEEDPDIKVPESNED